jgi:hypothetical protein
MPLEIEMDRHTFTYAAVLTLACLCTNTAFAQCSVPPDDSRWLLRIEHRSTYPAGPEWDTRITVYDDGCLVMDAPKALREGGGRTERDIPGVHLDGIKEFLAAEKMHALSAEVLVGEMKRGGHTDLNALGADSVTDAPYTTVSFRDPKTKAASRSVEIYALSHLTLPASLKRLAQVQDIVRAVDQLALAAALSRPQPAAARVEEH